MFAPGKVVSLDRTVDKRDLDAGALRAASALDSLGIGEGTAIAAFMRNDFPLFEAQGAATLLGAYFVTINWHLRGAEAEYILTDSEAKALIVHADLLGEIRDLIPTGISVFVVPTPDEIAAAYGIDARTRSEALPPRRRSDCHVCHCSPPHAEGVSTLLHPDGRCCRGASVGLP